MPDRPHPDTALQRLVEGNTRWVTEVRSGPRRGLEHISESAMGQYPFATIFTCSDSRVPAELVFDQGVGDLFVIRTAGHVVDEAVLGTIGFGAHALHTPLIVVLGHTSCGAVTAAYRKQEVHEDIQPVVDRIAAAACEADDLDGAIEAQVRDTVARIQPEILDNLPDNIHIRVVGAVYDLGSGKVRWL